MSELPAGWAVIEIGQINTYRSETIDPSKYPQETFELYSVPTFPTRQPEILQGEEIGSNKLKVRPDDVLLCKINPRINRVWAVGEKREHEQIASSEWIVLRQPHLDTSFIRYQLRESDFRERLCAEVSGVGGSLTRAQPKKVEGYTLRIAPLAEQKRIAQKLDLLLAQVDTLKARIDAIPAVLKRFRQSALSAAVSGKLTEDWREQEVQLETGQDVIDNDARAKRKLLRENPGLKNKKSSLQSEIEESYIFDIPGSWSFTTWGKLSEWITYGFTRPMPKSASGEKLLTAKNVQRFDLDLKHCGLTTQDAFEALSEKDKPIIGDLLITKDGSIGRSALVTTDERFCINQSVAVCWLRSTTMDRRFLEFLANSEHTQRFVKDKAQGMAIQHLSIIDFAKCPVPVPPAKEQTEIVRRIELLFAFADQLETKVAIAKQRIDALTQSLLAKAFHGELVPQDPNDEPASVLLERIRAQRAAAPKPKRGRKTTLN
ncbi:restriction endonuclease subunit S [Luteimonas qiangzhengi]|uniref:restriction endonuclease subunit S n=1 Tax=Luteimonas sp. MJ146 TaxID=3129240 RepID=UPI0031BA83C6